MVQTKPESGVSARRAATRNRLVDAAIVVFAREGIRGATVEQICDEAGFTRGAFYSNFESKNELITALVETKISRVRESLEVAIKGARRDSGLETLEVISRAAALFVAGQSASPELVLTLADLRLESARSPQVREAMEKVTVPVKANFCELLTTVLDEVGLQFHDTPESTFDFFEAAYEHLTLEAVTQGISPNSPELAERLTSLLTALTEPKTPSTPVE